MHTLTGKGRWRVSEGFLEEATTDQTLETCVSVSQVKNGGQVLHRRKQYEDIVWGGKHP